MVSAPGAGGVWDGMWCSVPGKRVGTRLCPHRLEGLARELGCVVGAGDLGRPGGQRCAESQLPGGRGCRGCQLLSAPGDAGARRPRMGPIYSGEPGGCRHGPVPGGRGCHWEVGCWHFLIRDGLSSALGVLGAGRVQKVERTRLLAALCRALRSQPNPRVPLQSPRSRVPCSSCRIHGRHGACEAVSI